MKDEEVQELKKELVKIAEHLLFVNHGECPPKYDNIEETIKAAERLKELAR